MINKLTGKGSSRDTFMQSCRKVGKKKTQDKNSIVLLVDKDNRVPPIKE